jgi:hypothetical protein
MADYKGIKGFKVQYLSADPSNPIIGQTWYNDTSKDLKFTEYQSDSWATGGNIGTVRDSFASAQNGTQTAALMMAGIIPPTQTLTEEYNGTSWSGGGSLSTARQLLAGAGTQTAGLAIAGEAATALNSSEEYDGSTWTGGGTLPHVIDRQYGLRITNSSFIFWWRSSSSNDNKFNR